MHFQELRKNTPGDHLPWSLRQGGKMFAIVGLEADQFKISLKADPEDAIIQRNMYEADRKSVV